MQTIEGKEVKTVAALNFAVTTGLEAGGKLRANRMFAVTETGLKFSGELSFNQFKEVGGFLRRCKDKYHLMLADWVGYGAGKFGKEAVEGLLVQMEFDHADAARALAIGSLDLFCRHPDLRSEHYWELCQANLSVIDQIKWSAAAVEFCLTPAQLRLSIRAGKVLKGGEIDDRNGRRSGLANLPGIRGLFDSWWKPLRDRDPVSDWDQDRKRAVLEELMEPTRLGMALAKDLGVSLEG